MRQALAAALVLAALGCGEPPKAQRAHPTVTSAEQLLRPTDVNSGLQWTFSAGEVVETYDSPDGGFKVHYTRAGKDAVPLADANDSGVPDFVEQVANVYDDVGRFYASLGFLRPLSDQGQADNGGDGRFDVYLVDFATNADGAFQVDGCSAAGTTCYGYVVQENDFAGYPYATPVLGTIILGSHEYFHAVQAAYDETQGSVIQEGTAVWGSETYDPSLDDFEGFIDGYLQLTERPLDQPPPGPVPAFAYGSAIWFRFLEERYERDAIRKLWAHLAQGQGYASEPNDMASPHWMIQQDAMLQTEYGSSFREGFRDFSTWNLYVGAAADAQHYREGAKYPLPLVHPETLPFASGPLLVFHATTHYYQVAVGGRTEAGAALVSTAPADTDGLDLVLAVRRGGVIVATQTAADVRALNTLPVQSGDQLVAIVVDGERAGNAKSPSLCMGDPTELQSCIDQVVPDAGMPDAGSDGGMTGSDGGVTLDVVPYELGHASGCSAAGGLGAWALGLLALAVRRRR